MLEIETEIKSEDSYREWRSQWSLQMKEGETESERTWIIGGWAMNGVSGGEIFGMKDYQVEMRVEVSWGLSGLSQYSAY